VSIFTDGRVRDSVMAHRYRFLWAVQELVPEVLTDLEQNVFPFFRALYREQPSGEAGEGGTAIWGDAGASGGMLWIVWPSLKEARERGELNWMGPSWASDIATRPLDSDRLAFRNAMEKWAATHNLCAESIKEDAFSTLRFWLTKRQDHLVWLPRGYSRTRDEMANVPTLHIDEAWNFQAWPIVSKRLQQQISVYKSEIKKYCEHIGFDLDRMREDRAHHQWLALYQCRGMSPEKISDWELKHRQRTVGPTAVSHAIETLAKKIGLERRPGRRGRSRSR
jgi:hypothetical protein